MLHEPLTFLDMNAIQNDVPNSSLIEASHYWCDEHSMAVKIIYDESLEIAFVSKSVYHVFGYERDELMKQSILQYIHPEHRDSLRDLVKTLPIDDKKSHEFRLLNSDGEYIDCLANSGQIVDPDTNKPFYVSVIQDIMEHKQAQQMLISSEKLSTAGQLAASIAHEIRNPITSLKGFLQLLETGIEGKEEYLAIMKDEIEKIEAISTEMLYIAKPSPNEFEQANIISILEDICMLMRSQARMNDIDLVLETDVEIHEIYCDPMQLKQVFINLIKNAIEAMENPGIITIRINTNEILTIEVIDEGPGVPDSLKEKLGQPFFTTKDKGTGLGLMVTLDILQNHHAELSILDREPQGSIFKIDFK
ncbi:ATP-binding protein [Alkalibacillus salilacus]|uniref:histidine kinase n=1 Tax=Alkalibacillus salilacus TaxID=284582 RepID=A0ABT9VDE6_9BACI|nr:ATP-binding protein [Alkalibacillus salilacus]MDQ0158929.1 PAS domain S-box-containing protein [Alkalibacillus salilacus]